MKSIRLLALALLLVAASCTGDGGSAPDAGGIDAAPDARTTDGGGADASADAAPADAGSADAAPDAAPPDAAPPDASAADAAPADAEPTCSACEPSGPCVTAACMGGHCVETPVTDGSTCGDEAHVCVAAICVARGCGDGFREPGPVPAREACDDGNLVDSDACSSTCTPLVLPVAARAGGSDRPAGTPRPAAAADGRGEVLVVWQSKRGPRSFAVMARRHSHAGVPRGDAFVVAQGFFDGETLQPTVAGGASGWVVAFVGLGASGDDDGTAVALVPVGAAGQVGATVRANTTTFSDQRDPVVARLANDDFAVAWTDRLGSAAETRVLMRRFSPLLAPVSDEVVVGAGQGASDLEPALAAGSDGFALAWTHQVLGETPVVLVRRFATTGAPLDATPLLVSDVDPAGTPQDGSNPALAARAGGGYVAAWTTYAADLRGDVRARVLTPAMLLPSFAVAERANAVERLPAIVAQGEGVAVLVHRGSGISDQLRDLELVYVGVDAPPELAALNARLATTSRQNAGSLALVDGGLWLSWAEDPFVPTQSPATLSFLMPQPELP